MSRGPLSIWCNLQVRGAALARLEAGTAAHRLLLATQGAPAEDGAGGLDQADVAFGQPDADVCVETPRLAWVHLSTAGYTAFDRPTLRDAFARRGAMLSSSSAVFAEPCAEHVLAFMLAEARNLPRSFRHQLGEHAWMSGETRASSFLLRGQTVVLVGFGSIAVRLAELLLPFSLDLVGVRRAPRGDEPIPVVALAAADPVLARADHVVNLLPAHLSTARFFDERRFTLLRRGAIFYNVGRGSTVDQDALLRALESGHLRAAYLDVTDPEPLPPEHPLWSAPGAVVTPHTAGGHADELLRLVAHFLQNLERYTAGRPLVDRIY